MTKMPDDKVNMSLAGHKLIMSIRLDLITKVLASEGGAGAIAAKLGVSSQELHGLLVDESDLNARQVAELYWACGAEPPKLTFVDRGI